MKILKFGGTSVGSPELIKKVIAIIQAACTSDRCIVVVSAFSRVTDQLIALCELAAKQEPYDTLFAEFEARHCDAVNTLVSLPEFACVFADVKVLCNDCAALLRGIALVGEVTPRSRDEVMSFGERLSATIVAAALETAGTTATVCDTRVVIKTDDAYGHAQVCIDETKKNLGEFLSTHNDGVIVATGFIGSAADGSTTTLGRGGSDYTASLLGALADAEIIEIWTDVEGIFTADPRKVAGARNVTAMTYEEAMELSYFGAKVLYYPTMMPAFKHEIPLLIKNTFSSEQPGTRISKDASSSDSPVTAITSMSTIAVLQVQGVGLIGSRGMAGRVFHALARAGVNVILISQCSSEYSICIAIEAEEKERAQQALTEELELEMLQKKIEPIGIENESAIIAVVGTHMRRNQGTAGRIFAAVGAHGINTRAIAQGSSERNISFVVSEADKDAALQAVHDEFFATQSNALRIFLAGTGLIGSTLLFQICENQQRLKNQGIDIRVCGLANAGHMFIDANGICLDEWERHIAEDGEPLDMQRFIERMSELRLHGSVFVDCTASQDVADRYCDIVRAGTALVAANKKAQSGTLASYQQLKTALRETDGQFFYETNVGAALPVIATLQDLIKTGDEVKKIEAVLSGTLSYIFNTFSESDTPFSTIVRQAKEKGYTEPDPRDDLSGMDVARKAVILARECGQTISVEDIVAEPLLSDSCMNAQTIEQFFAALEGEDEAWNTRKKEAEARGTRLRYIATVDERGAHIGLQEVDKDHPFYSLSGSDNIVSFTTARYCDTPLVIKGPGAGAQVTAGGVFADILKTVGGMPFRFGAPFVKSPQGLTPSL